MEIKPCFFFGYLQYLKRDEKWMPHNESVASILLFFPRTYRDEKSGGVGSDGDGAEEADTADEGAHNFGCDHVEVHDVQQGDIGLCGDEEDERERAADVGEDECIRHRAHDIASDVQP